MTKQDNRIPVTILTGFLGAGKTTLLNELITKYPEKKIAIIENEFGEIPIDNDLVIRPENGIFELSNGCICCTLNDELVEALERLLNSEHAFNHLLVETTGIAEPDSIAAAFLATPDIQAAFRIDGVVCVADAHYVADLLDEREEARQQLTFADYIILNKASEVAPDYLASVKRVLRQANPLATIEPADYCKIETNVLDLQAYTAASLEKKVEQHTTPHTHHHHHHDHTCDEHCDHDHEHSHDHAHEHHHNENHVCDEHCDHDHKHGHHHHHHHTDINSVSFVFKEPLDLMKFRHWINVILLVQNQSIYRIKGILNFAWEEDRLIFQSVQQMFVFLRGSTWENEDEKLSRIVFIGKNLRKDILEKSIKQCYYNPDEYEEM